MSRIKEADSLQVRVCSRIGAEADSTVWLHRAVADELQALADAINVTVDPAADSWTRAEACGRREIYRLMWERINQLRSDAGAAPHTQGSSGEDSCRDRFRGAVVASGPRRRRAGRERPVRKERILDTDIGEVRARNRIEEVVGEYVALRRARADSLKGLCPFHEEKFPSFHVRPAHGTFHCFGCGVGGSVLDFVMKIEHLGFVEALQRLAHRVGIAVTYIGGGPSVQRERGTRSRLVEVNRLAQEFYVQQLSSAEVQVARQFLAQRTFGPEEAARFGCGFALSGWDQLTKHLLGCGFSVAELIKAGISREGQRGPIDRFHRRLLWPIRDLGGDVVGFGARWLFDDDRIEAKYLNTPETPLYRKSQVLFGLDVAFTHEAYGKVHAAVLAAGGTSAGMTGSAWIDAVASHCPHRSLVTELAVEPLPVAGEATDTQRYLTSVLAGLRAVVVGQQVAEIRSRLQRLSPLDDTNSCHQLSGDLVTLQQYHRTLRERAA
jgi:hypothetical protein